MFTREIIELVKAAGILKVVQGTVAVVPFAAALYLRWKYAFGVPPL
jgi:hypothetical protein